MDLLCISNNWINNRDRKAEIIIDKTKKWNITKIMESNILLVLMSRHSFPVRVYTLHWEK